MVFAVLVYKTDTKLNLEIVQEIFILKLVKCRCIYLFIYLMDSEEEVKNNDSKFPPDQECKYYKPFKSLVFCLGGIMCQTLLRKEEGSMVTGP